MINGKLIVDGHADVHCAVFVASQNRDTHLGKFMKDHTASRRGSSINHLHYKLSLLIRSKAAQKILAHIYEY